MRIVLSEHARIQMMLRGIEEDQIIKVIKRGSRIKQTSGYLSIYTYIAVAYKKIGKNRYRIKTVMII